MASSAALPASAAVPVTGQGREFLLLKTATDGLKTAGADLQSAVNGLATFVQGKPLTTVLGSSEQSVSLDTLSLSHPLTRSRPFATAVTSGNTLFDGDTITKWVDDMLIPTLCRHLTHTVSGGAGSPTVTSTVTEADKPSLVREVAQLLDSSLSVSLALMTRHVVDKTRATVLNNLEVQERSNVTKTKAKTDEMSRHVESIIHHAESVKSYSDQKTGAVKHAYALHERVEKRFHEGVAATNKVAIKLFEFDKNKAARDTETARINARVLAPADDAAHKKRTDDLRALEKAHEADDRAKKSLHDELEEIYFDGQTWVKDKDKDAKSTFDFKDSDILEDKATGMKFIKQEVLAVVGNRLPDFAQIFPFLDRMIYDHIPGARSITWKLDEAKKLLNPEALTLFEKQEKLLHSLMANGLTEENAIRFRLTEKPKHVWVDENSERHEFTVQKESGVSTLWFWFEYLLTKGEATMNDMNDSERL